MGDTAKDMLGRALQLTVDERAQLAARLLESLDGEPADDVDQAWAAEIERRARALLAGDDNSEDWADVAHRIENRR